jgi:hypothetical protein
MQDDEYLDAQSPLDAGDLEWSATDVKASIAARLAGFERELAIYRHHHRGDAAAQELARKLAGDTHADVCETLCQFGRRT